MSNVIECRGVQKKFLEGRHALEILKGIDLDIASGEQVAIMGASGSGKSTLLHILGGLDEPTAGTVRIDGQAISGLSAPALGRLRNSALGFVYQFHHLLPEFSALENVAIPKMIAGADRAQARDEAMALLESVGLKDRAAHRPARLSGGEQQRVAMVRALANDPSLLLADEPTGNLDVHTADSVFDMMLRLVRETGLSALVATHNPDLARRMDRAVTIADGKLAAATV